LADTITEAAQSHLIWAGTLNENFISQSKIRAVNGSAPITIDGNLTLNTNSLVEIGIDYGDQNTDNGKFVVTGNLILDGQLDIQEDFSYDPQSGDQFEILSFDSRSGDFINVRGIEIKGSLYGAQSH
tara:strand:+ start:2247 stop:2627 length:381 start_codon:yes stop_codon:yes gene_type:complete